MYALPSLHLIESGSLPGYEFGVWRTSDVREAEVKRVFSRGRGTKDLVLVSSITQLMDIVVICVLVWRMRCCVVYLRKAACPESLSDLNAVDRQRKCSEIL